MSQTITLTHTSYSQKQISLLAYCVVPSVLLLVCAEDMPGSLDTYVGRISESMKHYYCALFKTEDDVFEESFIATSILTKNELSSAIQYVYSLPLRNDIVQDTTYYSYPWSSLIDILDPTERSLCDTDLLQRILGDTFDMGHFTQIPPVSK